MSTTTPHLLRKPLGLVEYEPTWHAMQRFTRTRTAETADELWLVEHPPVFTLGLAGKPEHLLRETGIPLVKIDRGGQITYHGPGQAVAYLLVDLARRDIKVRELVSLIEQAILDLLRSYNIDGHLRDGAPGVYVADAKIAALGLKIANGCSYHGLSLNSNMDLTPYSAINPCGYPGLESAQLKDFGVRDPLPAIHQKIADALDARFEHHHVARRAAA